MKTLISFVVAGLQEVDNMKVRSTIVDAFVLVINVLVGCYLFVNFCINITDWNFKTWIFIILCTFFLGNAAALFLDGYHTTELPIFRIIVHESDDTTSSKK